jgi:hypothetical protein
LEEVVLEEVVLEEVDIDTDKTLSMRVEMPPVKS